MRKTTITVADRHEAAYEAARRSRPSLALTTWIEEALDFRLRHGDEPSLRPAIKAQRELITKLDEVVRLLNRPQPTVDYARLERVSKTVSEEVHTSVHTLRQQVIALTQAVINSRKDYWILAAGGFALGLIIGAGGFYWISRIP